MPSVTTSTSWNGEEDLVAAWSTSHRVSLFLVERLPIELWPLPIPGYPRRTIRSVAAHLHNARCAWIRMTGVRHGIASPRSVSAREVVLGELARALELSSEGIIALIRFGMARSGKMPRAAWQNFPPTVAHFVSYMVAHEAHHRGQLVMLARQLGHRLPSDVTNGLWQWSERSKE